MRIDPPRDLTPEEQAVLALLIPVGSPEADILRQQVAEAKVVGRCNCGCPTIDLEVPASAPRAAIAGPLASTEAQVAPLTDEPPGQLLLFVREGRLSSLEYVYYSDRPPQEWPSLERLSPVTFDR